MSYPKAFVKINGQTRTSRLWGVNPHAYVFRNGAMEQTMLFAVEVEYPFGRPETIAEMKVTPSRQSLIVPLHDVEAINSEAYNAFMDKIGVMPPTLKIFYDGYGVAEKQRILEEKLKELKKVAEKSKIVP